MQTAILDSGPPARPFVVNDERAVTGPIAEDAVRGHTYSLLGAMLAAPPSPDLLALLRDAEPDSRAGGDFAAAWRQLALAAARADAGSLAQEYQDLFIGVGRGEIVPYGSWYTTGFMMDRPLAALRRDLRALGFERQDGVREPEDHAAALCETMAMLIADGHPLEGQRRFFSSHMGSWMKAFFRDLHDAPSASFYRAAGQFGEQFVDFETDYLGMLA